MLGIESRPRVHRYIQSEARPWPAQVQRAQVRRSRHEPGLLGQLAYSGWQDRLAWLARAGWRGPGPVTLISRAAVRPVQHEVLGSVGTWPPTADHHGSAVWLIWRDRQPIPGVALRRRHGASMAGALTAA